MTNIIFLGAPGSGKGTQSLLLSKSLNIPNISTGEILRKEVADNSQIGKLAKEYMDDGKLVPDEVIVDIIDKCISLADCEDGFILDGFPRNLAQGQVLGEMLINIGRKIDAVLNIIVPDDIIIKRISGRFSCKKCHALYNRFFNLPKKENICDYCVADSFESRSDDKEETVVNRLKVYHYNTMPLVSFYEKKSLIYTVDGLKTITLVNSQINGIIDSLNNQ